MRDVRIVSSVDKTDIHGKPVGSEADPLGLRLVAARGEVVGLALLVRGSGDVGARFEMPGLRTDLFRAVPVPSGGPRVPDPLVPFRTLTLGKDRYEMIVADVYVPFLEKRREIEGLIVLTDGREAPVHLTVRDFALPRRASFLCEMNTYGVPDSVATYDRLQEVAYDHRVHLNFHHYSHRTAAPGARKCNLDMRMANGKRMDEKRYNAIEPEAKAGWWKDFTEAFGPHLTGARFAQGHRGAVPLPGFYLTFHESWPLNVRAYFDGNPDAYEAFRGNPEYAETFVAVLRDFLRTARREGWADAGFQVYLNNKGSIDDPEKAPWILDEPTSYFDYRALAYYGDLVRRTKGDDCPIDVRYRIDISRPEFDRGELRDKADLWVVSTGAFRKYPRLVRDRAPDFWLYGSSNEVHESNRTIHSWVLEAYRGGATGVVPWQTVDRTGKALTVGDRLGLFILDGSKRGEPAVHHSLRLKAYRRAQQDVEYLEILRKKRGLTRGQIREIIDRHLALPNETLPGAFRALRAEVAALIEGVDQK